MGIFIIFFILALIFLGTYLYSDKRLKNKIKNCTNRTVGTIIEFTSEKYNWYTNDVHAKHSYIYPTWYPIYSYNINGKEIIKKGETGIVVSDFYIGQKVNLYYNPLNIEEIYVPEEKEELIIDRYKTLTIVFITIPIIIAVIVMLGLLIL